MCVCALSDDRCVKSHARTARHRNACRRAAAATSASARLDERTRPRCRRANKRTRLWGGIKSSRVLVRRRDHAAPRISISTSSCFFRYPLFQENIQRRCITALRRPRPAPMRCSLDCCCWPARRCPMCRTCTSEYDGKRSIRPRYDTERHA